MSDWIDVGGSLRTWWFLGLAALAVCLLAGGGMLFVANADGGAIVLSAGAACAVAAGLSAVAILARKCRVQFSSTGFQVHDRRGEREFADAQVICASLHSRANYSNGELKAATRTFDVWVENEAGPERIQMVNRIPVGAVDPLAALIERIHDYLYRQAGDALAGRLPFEGEGWMLHPNELVVSRRLPEGVRLDELAAVGVFDNDLCVWKHGQDEPAVRIPIRSANTHVLARLLEERVPDADITAGEPGNDRLGRLLFERKPGRFLRACVWLAPVVLAATLAACLVMAMIQRRAEPAIGGLIFCGVLGLIWLLSLTQYTRLRCHEFGISRRGLWRETRLRYSEVGSFTYSAVRQYVKGVYSGTTFTLTFAAHSDGPPRKLTYAKTQMNADAELESLRDRVSAMIASRMAERFAQNQPVIWTEGLRFLSDGLEYRAAGLLGRKPPIMLGYDQIQGFDAGEGLFRLWIAGQRKPVVKENVSQANFFPGLVFLAELLADRAQVQPVELSR